MSARANSPDSYAYPVQVWQFGKDLNLVALGGEVVVDYSLRLKAQHGWDPRGWPATATTCSRTSPQEEF